MTRRSETVLFSRHGKNWSVRVTAERGLEAQFAAREGPSGPEPTIGALAWQRYQLALQRAREVLASAGPRSELVP